MDAFLCFRGEDTRNNFISHLRRALSEAKIKAYIDDEIPRGDNISSSIFHAIETSRIAIIVFSPDFGSSKWCLDEVVKIMQRVKHSRQVALPVFFHVKPAEVRSQTGVFERIFAKLEEDFRDNLQKVETWRCALREAGGIAGWTIDDNVRESQVVQEIVEVVSSKLSSSLDHSALGGFVSGQQRPFRRQLNSNTNRDSIRAPLRERANFTRGGQGHHSQIT